MTTIRAFLELPAGLASVSLALQGGLKLRPPISRMGNKAGYAATILDALGLRPGQGAGAYWWAEADPDVAALLRIYPDSDALREVARIIRGWAGEEPRALWERLRAERRARGAAAGTVGEVAGWVAGAALSAKGMPDAGYNGEYERFLKGDRFAAPDLNNQADTADRLAEYAMIAASNRLIHVSGPDLANTGKGGTTFGGEFATPAADVAAGFERVAETVILQKWSFSERGWEHGYGGPGCEVRTAPGGWTTAGRDEALSADRTASLIEAVGRRWPPVRVSPRIPAAAEVAAAIGTPGDLEGCIVYADPPYARTTGYAHDLPRAEVVRYCLAYAAMGATVCVSEQEPIPELMQAGWYATEITADRVGARRTFSRQQAEWLTMSAAPKRRQIGLFNLFSPDSE